MIRFIGKSPGFHRLEAVVFAALLLLGAAVRIYGAWELRHNLNPDSGIVALMAKHMAEGVDFPVFFYGQAYMGSLEPMVSALFCALFGVSGFMVALGTAFVGWLILPAVFLWARDAHSSKAGLIAMAYCVVGPLGFLHYQLSPRGGYAVTILLATLILWLTAKLIGEAVSAAVRSETLNVQRPTSNVKRMDLVAMLRVQCWKLKVAACLPRSTYAKWLLLGLLAGLGWWTNQLIAGALITAALMGLFFLRTRIFSLNTLSAAMGFFAGSLPFWRWNYFNGWRSFEFAGSLGQTPFLTGLEAFLLERLPDLLDLNQGPLGWRLVLTVCFIGAAAWTFVMMRRAVREKQDNRWIHLLTIFVFILVSMLLFSTSHFATMNTSRYLLPLVPVVAVIIGIVLAELSKKVPVYLALIPLVLVIIPQADGLRGMARRGAGEEKYQRQIEECGRELQERGIAACYAPYGKHGWNFALMEKICFCDLPLDRYRPYARRAELADRIAVFDNLGAINNFVANYGGSAKINYTGDTPVCWNFAPPREGLAAIPPAEIESIRDSLDRNAFSTVTDGNLDTGWESAVERGDSEWLEINFKTPQEIGMVRLLFEEYPEAWQMAGQLENGRDKILTPAVQTAGYIWSGPRPYWSFGMNGYRLECRLASAKLKSLRIHRLETGWRLAEIQIFAPAPPPESKPAALSKLLNVIRERGTKRLYCDRWPANAIYRETQGAVQTPLDPDIFEGCSSVLSNKVWFTPRTGILIRREDEILCKQVLGNRMIEMRRKEIGPWVLLDFSPMLRPGARFAKSARRASQGEPGKWKTEYGREFELEWTGFACLAKNNKRWAAELVGRADLLDRDGKKSAAVGLLEKACREWPLYQPAIERLAWLTSEKLEIVGSPPRSERGELACHANGVVGDRSEDLPVSLRKAAHADGRAPFDRLKALSGVEGQARPLHLSELQYWKAEQKQLQPETAAEIKFAGGIEFAGISLSSTNVTAGEALAIKYFWRCPAGGTKNRPCVFVHFINGGNILQDDHPLSEFAGADCQPYPELFIETRNLIVPETAAAGAYRVKIGLYAASRPDLRRYKVKTDLPNQLNAVELPVRLVVKY